MDRIRLSAVLLAIMAISYALIATGTAAEPLIEAGIFSITLPALLFSVSSLLFINLWTHLLKKFNKLMMGSSVLKVLFFAIILFGTVTLIDFLVVTFTSYELGIIAWLMELFSG